MVVRKRKSPPVSEPLPSKRQQLDSIADTVKELKEEHGSNPSTAFMGPNDSGREP